MAGSPEFLGFPVHITSRRRIRRISRSETRGHQGGEQVSAGQYGSGTPLGVRVSRSREFPVPELDFFFDRRIVRFFCDLLIWTCFMISPNLSIWTRRA
ncbi:hypothetical protein ACTMTI_22995 [Nonomuraea sp. H19]|uniref:hypothetical protein n=1 Tax=Nonomuraea sp. H19 TaxID=3452206 RepID=UPI003F88E17B